MPTPTPSPHRFLASQSSFTPRTNAKPKSASNLRHGFTAPTPKTSFTPRPSIETPKVTPAKRFVIAPVRNTSGGATHGRDEEAWAQSQQTPSAKPVRKLERVESIEEGSQENSSGPSRNRDHHGDVGPSEQTSLITPHQDEEHGQEDEDDADAEMLFMPESISTNSNKRRRLSPAELSSPSRPRPVMTTSVHAQPQSQLQPLRTPAPAPNTHRFLNPAPRPPRFANAQTAATTLSTTPSTSIRPAFLLPPQDTSPPKPSSPLPETFSPSRKGQKYVPGGLASSLQSWIVETANTGYAAQTQNSVVWSREKDDGVKMRVRVLGIRAGGKERDKGTEADVECFAGAMVFVSGAMEIGGWGAHTTSRASSVARNVAEDEGQIRVMLAGTGGARGPGGVRIKIGNLVGVRSPIWDVDVNGEKWIIGVDWVVL